MSPDKHFVIVGGGFAGLNCAKELGNAKGIRVTVLDRRNHHLFQPLLYQVAMGGLSPAEIASPIRSLLSEFSNIETFQTVVSGFDLDRRLVLCDAGDIEYDYLVVGAGAKHSYFGNERWEEFAPGLKTLSQATEIRSRVLVAFENAEKCRDPELQKQFLTFVVVGGGPTGVELAGALGEMARFTLTKEFRHIDFGHVRILLVEGAPRLLAAFTPAHSAKAAQVLERLGVHVRTGVHVTDITADGVSIGEEFISAKTVLWGAGVQASSLGAKLGVGTDKAGRVEAGTDLSIHGHPEVFVAGDMAKVTTKDGRSVPGMAPAALQEGKYLGRLIKGELRGVSRKPFQYLDKGQMATIGRSQAVLESGWLQMSGFPAWLAWVVIHIFYLTGLRNRVFVVFSWAWAWLNFNSGARLIVRKEWRFWGPGA